MRARGAELAFGTNDILLKGLDLLRQRHVPSIRRRSRCRAARAPTAAPRGRAIGKQLPNIPKWRATASATYRPTDRFTLHARGRYSSKLYTTLDNADVRYNTYQGFSEWFVMDTKANYR